MFDRSLVGRVYPPFRVRFRRDLVPGHERLPGALRGSPPRSGEETPLLIRPKILLSHGTACLLTLRDDLGTDPQRVRLVREEFLFERTPLIDEELTAALSIAEIEEQAGPDGSIDDRIDLVVEFNDMNARSIARYTVSYCVPIARPAGSRG